MGQIHVLPAHIQNKIAAGEVVERPSSIVKEITENSLDAGATVIEVFIKNSGMESIKVVDNGRGIDYEDRSLIFERHATSKLDTAYELFEIRSLGFRGEALASIGAVAKVSLQSMSEGSTPFKMVISGGDYETDTVWHERPGTIIEIKDLFFNTPARLKYIKNLRTETGKIIDIMQRMALNNPDVSFRLVFDGKDRFKTTGSGNLKEVINILYGTQVSSNAIPVSGTSPDYTIDGFIVRPEVTRSNRNYINLSINNRHVRHFKLSQSIINAYHTLQPKDKYPLVFLNITMDPKLIDVNVHPSKIEVKLSKEAELLKLMEDTVKNGLMETQLIPEVEHKKPKQEQFDQPAIDFTKREEQIREHIDTYEPPAKHMPQTPFRQEKSMEDLQSKQPYTNPFKQNTPVQKETGKPADIPAFVEQEPLPEKQKLPYLEIIGQLHGTYIIMQNETGMYLMDQHAAQERIKYEYIYKNIIKEDDGIPLLIPYTFEFSFDDVITIDEKLSELQSLGFDIEKSGMKQYTVSRYPSWIKAQNPEEDINDLIDFISHTDHFDVKKYREEMSIMMSCKQSIKANHYLDKNQMTALLEELGKCHSPYTCPHGRPVIIHMTTYEIERMFNRIMK
ncbi:DNA mismatch repair protein MutL [Jeotgalicoccus aerolatus]|uniref:DNA mismatch repair protein MutL n=1 Tax=Jeotgalicoccus aerolatus TaxID=709510 RepID=A0ABS4HKZ6_9STAP|nr:DNA mismatch repair endonuclease MutL [Jeotgalicoccus aerolatus]MBP1951518.1 DNA mismatch repair protein MutL [Jeotgalicoccus aerolatus]GGD96915.1 DNA mismatch repair protein MutL [Jeotgalicoccus aerolatus]CAD2076275.1 DNA mismatch repair protein MutL [Jeotgalicoccus aerolatus]